MRALLSSRRLPRLPRVIAASASALALLAAPAAACPSCSVGQGLDTLGIILAFMLIPYVVVSCIWVWMRRLMAGE